MISLRKHAPGPDGKAVHVVEMSMADMMTVYDRAKPHPNCNLPAATPNGGDWYNYLDSLDDATALLANGWREGASKLEALAAAITPPTVASVRRRPRWGDEGDNLDCDRAMAGQWDAAWRTTKREQSTGVRTIDIFAMWGGHCDLSAEEMFWTGAAALVACDLLEAAGFSVAITASNLAWAGRKGALDTLIRTDVRVKGEDEPLRVDALASVCCHAGIFRSYGFEAQAHHEASVGTHRATYRGDDWLWCMPWPTEYRERMAAAGEIPERPIVLNYPRTRAECIAEIERIISLATTM